MAHVSSMDSDSGQSMKRMLDTAAIFVNSEGLVTCHQSPSGRGCGRWAAVSCVLWRMANEITQSVDQSIYLYQSVAPSSEGDGMRGSSRYRRTRVATLSDA
mmetsp:Transcript_43331/g.86684  ORF Transcript_43331/g.86684 Transcript_43331/m.86684 type:complete len:101 (-) Transcript_43331:995-1297(-)